MAALAFLLVGLPATAQMHCSDYALRGGVSPGDIVSGVVRDGPWDIWCFVAQRGDSITIESWRTSGNLAPALALHYGDIDTNPVVGDENRDGGDFAQIRGFIAPAYGEYFITAGRKCCGTGWYQLKLEIEPAQEPPRSCSTPPRLRIGGSARNSSDSNNNVRSSARVGARVVGSLRPGDVADVLDGPVYADGYNWWRVRRGSLAGWTAESGDCEYWMTPHDDAGRISDDRGDRLYYGEPRFGRLDDGNYFDDFVFDAGAGDVVSIIMDRTSGDLDPKLRLYRSDGAELTENDDGGPGNNARIDRYRFARTDRYTVHALRYAAGQSGRYEIKLILEDEAPAEPVYAGIVVDSYCSLSDAIRAANRDRGAGGCPGGNGADTITLTESLRLRSELPRVESDITIAGNGYRIGGGGDYRIFIVESNGALTINDATLADGYAADDDELNLVGDGGAILNHGLLRTNRVEFVNNVSGEDGGAIRNLGEAHIDGGSFRRNRADRQAGAIYSSSATSDRGDTASVTINDVEFSDNRSTRHAGALFISGGGAVSGSGFINNSAQISGGAIYNLGQLDIRRSDFHRNRSQKNGGAIFNDYEAHITIRDGDFRDNATVQGGGAVFSYGRASATISDSRFSGNSASQGGGVFVKGFARGGRTYTGELSLRDSSFSNNRGGDCIIGEYGDLRVNSGNRFSDGGCRR